jgi:broad specificity phosphatase PhoE
VAVRAASNGCRSFARTPLLHAPGLQQGRDERILAGVLTSSRVETLVLVRHDLSIANVDPRIYKQQPDHTIPLADPESPRLAKAGLALRGLALPADQTVSWCSTYVRCRQTEAAVLAHAFGPAAADVRRRETFLVREQDFGEWDGLTDDEAKERLPASWSKRQMLTDKLGRFYFRYPNGESRADVVTRTMTFFGKLHRSDYKHHLVFLHGVSQRAFRMAWRNLPVDWFEDEPNPPNASVLVMTRNASGIWQDRYIA